MGSFKLKGKDLKSIQLKNHQAKSMALEVLRKHYKHTDRNEQLTLLKAISSDPERYLSDHLWSRVAQELMPFKAETERRQIDLLPEARPFQVFGRKLISSNAYQQMQTAMKLPIALYGALMPDAHQGYGLPIGGVLAAENAVIPYGVGMDIGCRMSLTLYNVSEDYFRRHRFQFEQALRSKTYFGNSVNTELRQEHEILDNSLFNEIPLLRKLRGKAVHQLGTSGSGNHFVEFGRVELTEGSSTLSAGTYLGILAHSGSRGLGAGIAQYYTGVAREECYLPKAAAHLAWLNLDSEAGQEYWLAMNLAGEYAKACHDRIHLNLAETLGLTAIDKIENHHNFAWKETIDGKELIVHRKGSTPANAGELGIIPGSVTAPGYIVKGLGEPSALSSASHGAGRKLSRGAAKMSITGSEVKKYLKQQHVKLIGGGTDEAPQAYKDIGEVMRYQKQLVKTLGKFYPMLVRMDKH